MSQRPAKLYHVTTPKKAKRYGESERIIAPVRGFDTLVAALAWAVKTGRTEVLQVEVPDPSLVHKLPDHHNQFGEAWWIDGDVTSWKGVFSGGRVASASRSEAS